MRFTVDGRTVNATSGGRPIDRSHPLLVFVHGAGGDRTVWSLQTRFFAHHGWSVLAVDLPGHGRSDGPAPDHIEGYSEWLRAVIEAVGYERAALIGHSVGSYIALDTAARHPETVSKLALLGTAATMPVHPQLLSAAVADDHIAVDLITSWSYAPQSQLGGHPTPGTWIVGSGSRLLERSPSGALGAALTAAESFHAATELAAKVVCPVLLLLGAADRMTPVRNAEPLAQALPAARTVIVDGAGHFLMAEQPDAVIDALAEFLGAP